MIWRSSARGIATKGGVEMRSAPFLWLDGAEVLHVPADTPPGVCQNRSNKAGK